MTHKNTLPDEMKIACCAICTLATGLRDCQSCPFNIGLIYKTLEQVKQAQLLTTLSESIKIQYYNTVSLMKG